LKNLEIQAREGGWLYDIAGWRFEGGRLALGMPVELEDAAAVQGLPASAAMVRPRQPKVDPAQKSFEEQDKS
jgi:hypothetical protein